MTPLHLLAEYDSLVQQHEAQFSPALKQLQATVNQTLHQLRQQERSLVEAQAQQLAQLKAQLAIDARILVPSTELRAFVAEMQATPAEARWNQTEPDPGLNANPATWQFAQTELPLAIYDYEATVDHDAYDDERTHSAYGYKVTIQISDQNRRLEVLTHQVYSPVEQREYTLRQQLRYYVEGEVAGLLRAHERVDSIKTQLAKEISTLVGCAARLLALTPQTVQFHDTSTEE